MSRESDCDYAFRVWPKHGDGTLVRFGEVWRTEEFGRIPIERITFSRGGVWIGDNCGHGKYLDNGAAID